MEQVYKGESHFQSHQDRMRESLIGTRVDIKITKMTRRGNWEKGWKTICLGRCRAPKGGNGEEGDGGGVKWAG